MTIEQVVAKYNGVQTPGAQWWPDGARDNREMIVELPWHADHNAFEAEMNAVLFDPVQYIADADDNSSRTFLYYTEYK